MILLGGISKCNLILAVLIFLYESSKDVGLLNRIEIVSHHIGAQCPFSSCRIMSKYNAREFVQYPF